MTRAGKPIWPKVPASFVRAMLAGHSALGLAFAALIFLVCFSGSLAVFVQEFQRWEGPTEPMVTVASAAALQQGLAEGQRLRPDATNLYMNLPEPEVPRFTIFASGPGGPQKAWALDETGHAVGPHASPMREFVEDLHIYLHLPHSWGIFVVGATGVALLSSLVSGILSHPRVFRDAFHLRWGGSKRLQEADLHNRIGIWALPFHVTISLTGALLGLSTVIVGVLALVVFKGDTQKAYALFTTPEPAHDTRAAPLPNLAPMLATVARDAPNARLVYVIVEEPRQAQQHISISVQHPGRLSREIYSFDRTGNLLGGSAYGARNLGERLFSAIGSVHFGWFAGWPVKVAYGLLGLGLSVVTSSGVAIWLARRRAKGRPAPRWERIWIATVWSQPFACGVTALATVIASAVPPVAAWGVSSLAALALAAVLEPARISAALRIAGSIALGATAVAHVMTWRGQTLDPVAWLVDVVLIVLAVALTTPQFMARTPARAVEPEVAREAA